MYLENFWSGFFKYSSVQGVFKGLAKATTGTPRTLDYGAMKAQEAAKKMVHNPNTLQYQKMGPPKFIPGSGQAEGTAWKKNFYQQREQQRNMARRQQLAKGTTPHSEWQKALQEPPSGNAPV